MKRRLMTILLTGVICLLGVAPLLAQTPYATFQGIEEFSESPVLTVKVEAGELPPVEERLPEEPLVIEPFEEIGQYGGMLQVGTTGIAYMWDFYGLNRVFSYQLTPEGTFPYAAKKWEISKDGKTLTVYLRKGMRWSNGAPLTTEDVEFYWNDVFHNEELTPSRTAWLKDATLEVVDNYIFRLHFPEPNPLISSQRGYTDLFALPKSYLKKFHIKYNPKAIELAKEEGYDYWWQLFNSYSGYGPGQTDIVGLWNPDLPSISPWIVKRVETSFLVYERNPYFWAVDTAGNQLPYIDRVRINRFTDSEAYVMKAISGELSYAGAELTLEDTPLFQENAEKGDYRVLFWKGCFGMEVQYLFNLTHNNPTLRKIFRDIRFKQAVSVAINRDEINEAIYFGEATPRQATILPTSAYYNPEFAEVYTEYDPDEANALLDEMGLEWDEDHKWRLSSDGKPLTVIGLVPLSQEAAYMPVSELVKIYWENIGVQLILKELQWETMIPTLESNDFDLLIVHMDGMTPAYFLKKTDWLTPFSNLGHPICSAWGLEWWRWFKTEGERGEEPPEKVKQVQDWKEILSTTLDEEERARAAEEILRAQAENLWLVGTVGMAPKSLIVKNNLRNVTEKSYWGFDYTYWRPAWGIQWFFKQQ